MQFARRRLAVAIDALPESQKLYATLSFFEELDDVAIGKTLDISHEETTTLARETRARLAAAVPLTGKEASTLQRAAKEALRRRLREITGRTLDRAGRIADAADAFVASIGPDERRDRGRPWTGRRWRAARGEGRDARPAFPLRTILVRTCGERLRPVAASR